MLKKAVVTTIVWALVLFPFSRQAEACSTYVIQTGDGHTYWTRTMDLLIDTAKIGTGFRVIPVGTKIAGLDMNHQEWTAAYDMVGAGMGFEFEGVTYNGVSDGVNSAGLSGGMFWLNSGTYDEVNPKVGHTDFVTYVLTNFATVEEIAAAAVDGKLNLGKSFADINSFHFTFTDKEGKTIVIEPIKKDGKFVMSMYTNYESASLNAAGMDPNNYMISINVMTNSPTYDEMIASYNNGTIEKSGASAAARFYRLAENKKDAHDLESYAAVMMKVYTPFGMDAIDSHTEWNTRYCPIYDVESTGGGTNIYAYIKPGDSVLSTKYQLNNPSVVAFPENKPPMRSFDVANTGVDLTDPTLSYWVIGDYKRGGYFADGTSTPGAYSNMTTASLATDPTYKEFIIHTNTNKEYGYSLGGVGYFRNNASTTGAYDIGATAISNNTSAMNEGYAFAGAIFNDGAKIDFSHDVSFADNSATGMVSYGGAIFNNYYLARAPYDLGTLTFKGAAEFVNNKAGAATSYLSDPFPVFSALGGAVFNYAGVLNFNEEASFDQNSAQGCFYAAGGAISNSSISLAMLVDLEAVLNFNKDTSFTNNSAISIPYLNNPSEGAGNAHGGALFNFGGKVNFGHDTTTVNALFQNNSVKATEVANGGAISNTEGSTLIINGEGVFKDNTATVTSSSGAAYGGALYNSASIVELNAVSGDIVFTGNTATSAGGAIFNADKGMVNLNATAGNTILFETATDTVESGQVYSYTYKGDNKTYYSISPYVSESDFVYLDPSCTGASRVVTESKKGEETGLFRGAVYVNYGTGSGATTGSVVMNGAKTTIGTLEIVGGEMVVNSPLTVINHALVNGSTLALNTPDGGVATVNSGLVGTGHVIKDKNGTLNLGGDSSMFMGNFTMNGGGVNLLPGARYFRAAKTTIGNAVTLNLANNNIDTINFGDLDLNGVMNLGIDFDGKNSASDTIGATTLTGNGNIVIDKIHYLSVPSTKDISIAFAEDTLRSVVSLSPSLNRLYTPIFDYGVVYDPASGRLNYHATNFSPSILAAPVAAQIGGYLTQLKTYDRAFDNRDMAILASGVRGDSAESTDADESRGAEALASYQAPESRKAVWVKPFASFETVGLRNGPRVDNRFFGAIGGVDSPRISLQGGWSAIYSVYAGYNDSRQKYEGIEITQNGGTVGATGYFYKGNFFTGLTANVGGNYAHANTRFGDENFSMFMTGVASKTGYNWKLADGKFIIQPNYLMSYTFVNTADYGNAAGVRVKSDPLNAVQLAPGIKFIVNLENDWQSYASVQMIWNVANNAKFTADAIALPNLSAKNYVQYEAGVQKRWNDRVTAYGQAMFSSGGKDSVALQFGVSYSF